MKQSAIIVAVILCCGDASAEIVNVIECGRPQQTQSEMSFELREFLGIDLVNYKPRTRHDNYETIQLEKKFRTFDHVGISLNSDRSRPIEVSLRSKFGGVKYEDVYDEAYQLADIFSRAYGIRFTTGNLERGPFVFRNENVEFHIVASHGNGEASLGCSIRLKKQYNRFILNPDDGIDMIGGEKKTEEARKTSGEKCFAVYSDGRQCQREAKIGEKFCSVHIGYDSQNPPFRLDDELPVNDDEKKIVTERKLKRIEVLLTKYSKKHGGKYPKSWTSFCAAMPTLEYPPQKDGWGGRFEYEQYGDYWVVASAGKDRKIGTDDDLLVTNYKASFSKSGVVEKQE